MSGELEVFRPRGGVPRRAQRELTNLAVETGLTIRRVDAKAEIEAAKVSAIASVGQRAMQEVAMITTLEREYGAPVGATGGHLGRIAESTKQAIERAAIDATRPTRTTRSWWGKAQTALQVLLAALRTWASFRGS